MNDETHVMNVANLHEYSATALESHETNLTKTEKGPEKAKTDYEKARGEYETAKEGYDIAKGLTENALKASGVRTGENSGYADGSAEQRAVLAATKGADASYNTGAFPNPRVENAGLAEELKTPGQVLVESSQDVATFEEQVVQNEIAMREAALGYLPHKWKEVADPEEILFAGTDGNFIHSYEYFSGKHVENMGKMRTQQQLERLTGTKDEKVWQQAYYQAKARRMAYKSSDLNAKVAERLYGKGILNETELDSFDGYNISEVRIAEGNLQAKISREGGSFKNMAAEYAKQAQGIQDKENVKIELGTSISRLETLYKQEGYEVEE